MTRVPLPPFTAETARQKVQSVEDAWNTRDPNRIALACRQDSTWRDRAESFTGHAEIREFLTRKWQIELHYRLRNELWSFTDYHISMRSEYEWQNARTGQWYRTHGNEHWEFDDDGLVHSRDATANDTPIEAASRHIGVARSRT